MGDEEYSRGFKGQNHGISPDVPPRSPGHRPNTQTLIEKIIRERIFESVYWKEFCLPLNAATLINQAAKLKCIGGTYSNTQPTEFTCLAFKLLQNQPEREIIMTYLEAEKFKYVQALAMFYIRLTFPGVECYQILELFLNDYRKIQERLQNAFSLTHVDEFVDSLLSGERVCETALPRIPTRLALEGSDALEPRVSLLEGEIGSDDDMKDADTDSDWGAVGGGYMAFCFTKNVFLISSNEGHKLPYSGSGLYLYYCACTVRSYSR
jgi:pre-mRNA-splicing factor 38A